MAMAVESASSMLARATHNGSGPSSCDKKILVKEPAAGPEEPQQPEPEVDIVINNVVCSFNVRCHLNLRDIALRGLNVEYRKENGVRYHLLYNWVGIHKTSYGLLWSSYLNKICILLFIQ